MKRVTPAATEASAMALPWAVSMAASAFSQTSGGSFQEYIPEKSDGTDSAVRGKLRRKYTV
jgi:hypothetical protein